MKIAKTLAVAALCLSVCSAALAAPAVKAYKVDEGSVKITVPQVKGAAGGKFADHRINNSLNFYALQELYKAFPVSMRNDEVMRAAFDKTFSRQDSGDDARDFIEDVAKVASFKLRCDLEDVKQYGGTSVESYDLQGQYTVHFNGDNLLSVEQQGYIYTGGAHGMTLFNAATFDLTTGRELELADLFKNGSNYLERINKEVAAQVADESRMFFGPVEVKNGDTFYFNKNGDLVIAYEPYEVAPYAAGIIRFTIPCTQLEDILAVEVK